MKENKTKLSDGSAEDFINKIDDEQKKNDCLVILELMKKVTGAPPKMWGESIIGFGDYHYKYQSGREGDWFNTGFSPRKQNLTVYLNYGFENNKDLKLNLGKYKVGKACLYFRKLQDIDINILEKLIKSCIKK